MTVRDRQWPQWRAWLPAIGQRALMLGVVWWALADGRADSWAFGLASVALAVVASLWLSPPMSGRVSFPGVMRFCGFFLLQSVKSGIQVAGMALRVPLDLAPAVLDVPTRLPRGPRRVLLAYTLALLPGTMSVRLDGDRLRLHVLDSRLPIQDGVRAAQAHIAALVGDGP